MSDDADWTGYYRSQGGRAPRPFLLDALACFDGPRDAVDLGSGAGIETLELLRRGWRVLAVDREPEAIRLLESRVPPEHRAALATRVATFEDLALPAAAADLVYAGVSVPFCAPDRFGALWAEIRRALRPGGRFAGQLFGPRDSWAGERGMTFHTREEVAALLDGLEVEVLEETERDGAAYSGPKHWHVFDVVARRGLAPAPRP